MKNFKFRRTALAVALVLTVMLSITGGTIAWFTDSVESKGNVIEAGNLDIKLEQWIEPAEEGEEGKWEEVTENSEPIFNYSLWEPGFTQLRKIKLTNAGTLALKFELNIEPTAEAEGDYNLADVIEVYFGTSEAPMSSAELHGMTAVGTIAELMADEDGAAYGVLLANGQEPNDPEKETVGAVEMWIALHMQETADNNYQNLSVGEGFGLHLAATQYTYEEDSFNNEYDKDAFLMLPGYLYSADDAYGATQKNGEYTLGNDIKPTEGKETYSPNRAYAVRDDKDVTINLNGHAIEYDLDYNGFIYLYTVAYNSTLTINGEGTLRVTNDSANAETSVVYAQSTGTVIINGGNFNPKNGVAAWAGNGSHITINGGSFVSDGEKQCELIYSSGGVIDIYGGFFHNTAWEGRPVNVANANRNTGFINIYGGTFVNFDPSSGGDDPNNILIADGYKVVSETQDNGDVWYTVVPE